MKEEQHTVSRGFDAVASSVKRRSHECRQFGYSRTTSHGATMHTAHVIYNVKFKNTSGSKATMTIQRDRLPRADHDPPGGYYIFVADMEKRGDGKTGLKMLGPSVGWGAIFDAVKGWAQGKNVECPDSP